MITTYHNFVANQFARNEVAQYRFTPNGFSAFFAWYRNNEGYSEWLGTFRGKSLSLSQTHCLLDAYLIHGNRAVSEIPAIISILARVLDVHVPDMGMVVSSYRNGLNHSRLAA